MAALALLTMARRCGGQGLPDRSIQKEAWHGVQDSTTTTTHKQNHKQQQTRQQQQHQTNNNNNNNTKQTTNTKHNIKHNT
jgi:hypothetical protein